ncbi:MAG: efflux RND transporter periplasmic adaptor subunit [Flavobacteriales bacterium]|nr:efflux RND transporter periplasmic adaptor subunit [Flavobacteriales bacterium]
MKKITLYVLAFAAFLGSCGKKDITLVSTETVEKRTIVETVSANGKIRPETEVKISSDVSGEIVALYVAEGDSVTVGQPLAEINPEILATSFEAATAQYNNAMAGLAGTKARLDQAKAQMTRAEADYNRQKQLFDKKAISTAEFETAKANFEVAKSELAAAEQNVSAAKFSAENARAGMSQASKNLSRSKIYAPVSGTVSLLAVEKGERVVGVSQMSGTELLRIANLNEMQVVVEVNENEIVRLSLGDTAAIEVDAYPNQKFKGIVTQMANSPKSSATSQLSSDEVTKFEVKIRMLRSSYQHLEKDLPKGQSPFRPGMSATVKIFTESVKDQIAVPIQSVTAKPDTGSSGTEEKFIEYVFVVKNDTVEMRKVITGIQDNRHIAIVSGIEAGENVVEGPYGAISKTLKSGTKIKVVPREALFETKK